MIVGVAEEVETVTLGETFAMGLLNQVKVS